MIVTIDGPAASGKTSVSRELAKRLGPGWSWLSTGAFYRGLAFVATHYGVSLDDEMELSRLALDSCWEVRAGPDFTRVLLNGQDVTEDIGKDAIGSLASKVSFHQKVREALLRGQRQCAQGVRGFIAEGRDCGSVVFPEAQVKVYVTANQENRAVRRALEQGLSTDSTRQSQAQRDAQDSKRATAPLMVPEGALVIDTTELSLDEVVDRVEDLVRRQQAG